MHLKTSGQLTTWLDWIIFHQLIFFSSMAQPRSKIATTGIVRLKLWKSPENLHVGADFIQRPRLSHLQERELWAEQLMHIWMKINEVTLHKLFKTMQQCNKVKGGPMKCKSPPTAPDNGKLAWLVTETGSSGFVNFPQIHPVQSQTAIGVRSSIWVTPVSGHNVLARRCIIKCKRGFTVIKLWMEQYYMICFWSLAAGDWNKWLFICSEPQYIYQLFSNLPSGVGQVICSNYTKVLQWPAAGHCINMVPINPATHK